MNLLKNILFFGLLLAVLCGVYLSLNRSPDATMPAGLETNVGPPKVEIPGFDGGTSEVPVSTGPGFSGPPNFPTQPPSIDSSSAAGGGSAPPYRQGPESISISMPPPIGSGTASLPAPPSDSYVQRADSIPPRPATPPDVAPKYPPGAVNPFEAGNNGRGSDGNASVDDFHHPPSEHPSTTSIELIEDQVEQRVKDLKYADALLLLSQLYGSPDVPPDRARKITEFLDKLAAKVIYSREHLLENPYRVQPGDTLETIAERYHVPALVLARINGIDSRDWQNLPPGKELKVLKGPFSAEISTDRSELTMKLAGRYAGRFSIALSSDVSQASGIWRVGDKRAATPGGNGTDKQWIQLSGERGNISMQGTSDAWGSTGSGGRNSIWLSDQDMDDVFGILSVGSNVIIQR